VSDIPQAPDWWQASDGKWYPPQAGQSAPDPFQQMQQGSTVPGSTMPTGVTFGGIPGYNQGTGKGCMSLWVIITVVTLLIGGAITAVVLFAVDDATDTIDDTFDTDNEAIDSVEVTDCGRAEDRLNSATATVDVTNDGDGTATYFIDVAFESRNGNRQFGNGNVTISGLAAGNTTSGETGGIVEIPQDQRFTCRVTSVDRIETG
jgi:hypothetical protein